MGSAALTNASPFWFADATYTITILVATIVTAEGLRADEGMSRSVVVAGVCHPGGRPHRGQPQTVHDARHSLTHLFRTLLSIPPNLVRFAVGMINPVQVWWRQPTRRVR